MSAAQPVDAYSLLTEQERELEFSLRPVALPTVSGPLDLLLLLLRRRRLSPSQISLAAVTDQFLEFAYQSVQLDADEAAEFLAVGAALLALKARLMLPREESSEEEPEEVPLAQQLAQRLEEMGRLRIGAEQLAERFERRKFLLPRGAALQPKTPHSAQVGEVSLAQLVDAFQQIMERAKPTPALIRQERVSLKDTIRRVANLLHNAQRPLPLRELLGEKPSRVEVIVCFLALLELIRRGRAVVIQKRLFGELEVCSPSLLRAEEARRSE